MYYFSACMGMNILPPIWPQGAQSVLEESGPGRAEANVGILPSSDGCTC